MIKNYTSTVSAAQSIRHIEDRLAAHGASQILKTYSAEKKLAGIAFIIKENGRDIPFQLPSRVDRVEKKLRAAVKRPLKSTYANIALQAERTAWKLLSDWVDIQMSLIDLNQVEFLEVFLPYIWDFTKSETFFEKCKKDEFLMLTHK
jgi:hypothetical protein